MHRIIRYWYKDSIILEELLSNSEENNSWSNNNPPYQPNNWDRWEIKEIETPYILYNPVSIKEVVF